MKRLFIVASVLLACPALAQQQQPDPAIQALGQMLGEGQQREAQSLARAYAAEARARSEAARADAAETKAKAETERADAAEKKLAEAAAVKP